MLLVHLLCALGTALMPWGIRGIIYSDAPGLGRDACTSSNAVPQAGTLRPSVESRSIRKNGIHGAHGRLRGSLKRPRQEACDLAAALHREAHDAKECSNCCPAYHVSSILRSLFSRKSVHIAWQFRLP